MNLRKKIGNYLKSPVIFIICGAFIDSILIKRMDIFLPENIKRRREEVKYILKNTYHNQSTTIVCFMTTYLTNTHFKSGILSAPPALKN